MRIKNFRCLKDVVVPLDKTTILIGENNAGKTTFLDAIRLGLKQYRVKSSPFDEYDYFLNDVNMTPKESGGIIIDFVFGEQSPNEWSDNIKQILGEIAQPTPFDEDMDESIYKIWLRVKSCYDEVQKDYIVNTEFLNYKGEPLAAKAQSYSKYNEFLSFNPVFYLQALRDIKDAFSSNSPLWGRFLKKIDIPEEKMQEIYNELLSINNELVESDPNLTRMIQSLEQIQKVTSLNNGKVVSVNALPLTKWDILSKSQVVMKGKDNEVAFPIERHGQGTQSLAIIFLFQAYFEILLKLTFTEDSEAILTLEEPEAHLHPQAVRALSKKLDEIRCQKIITTHSPYFFQNMNLLNLRVFRRIGDETKVFYLIDNVSICLNDEHKSLAKFVNSKNGKFKYYENSKKLIAYEPISEHEQAGLLGMYGGKEDEVLLKKMIDKSQFIITKYEANALYTYVQRTRGELFYARGWLLAEGQTEYIIMQYFSEVLGFPLDENGISFIDYQNNGSPGAFVKLAKSLNYPWLLLSDNDTKGQETVSEIRKLGYSEVQLGEHINMLPYVDFETFLANEGFLEEYKIIVTDQIDETAIDSLSPSEYNNHIANLIKHDKVGNANKLVNYLKDNKFDVSRVPALIKDVIERCVKKANE